MGQTTGRREEGRRKTGSTTTSSPGSGVQVQSSAHSPPRAQAPMPGALTHALARTCLAFLASLKQYCFREISLQK